MTNKNFEEKISEIIAVKLEELILSCDYVKFDEQIYTPDKAPKIQKFIDDLAHAIAEKNRGDNRLWN